MDFAIPDTWTTGTPVADGSSTPCSDQPDVLELPTVAGRALLRRGVRTGPVACDRATRRMRLLVPAGSADELPGLLAWLEWEGVRLELTAHSPYTPRETAVWLRPPARDTGVDRVDLVRLVSAAATECHRALLARTARAALPVQPLAFS